MHPVCQLPSPAPDVRAPLWALSLPGSGPQLQSQAPHLDRRAGGDDAGPQVGAITKIIWQRRRFLYPRGLCGLERGVLRGQIHLCAVAEGLDGVPCRGREGGGRAVRATSITPAPHCPSRSAPWTARTRGQRGLVQADLRRSSSRHRSHRYEQSERDTEGTRDPSRKERGRGGRQGGGLAAGAGSREGRTALPRAQHPLPRGIWAADRAPQRLPRPQALLAALPLRPF